MKIILVSHMLTNNPPESAKKIIFPVPCVPFLQYPFPAQNRVLFRFLAGSFSIPKMMILQGVRHPIQYLGVCYVNDPKKGGFMAPAPVLGLTALFKVIFPVVIVKLWWNSQVWVLALGRGGGQPFGERSSRGTFARSEELSMEGRRRRRRRICDSGLPFNPAQQGHMTLSGLTLSAPPPCTYSRGLLRLTWPTVETHSGYQAAHPPA